MKSFRQIAKDGLPVSLIACAETMTVETWDADGENMLRKDDVVHLCRALRFPKVAVLDGGVTVGGEHPDTREQELLSTTHDVELADASFDNDHDRSACADALAELMHEAASFYKLNAVNLEVLMP